MAAGVKDVDSLEEFNKLLNNAGSLVVVHFAAPWAPQCRQMTDIMSELSKEAQLSQVQFIQVEAEKLAEVSEKNKIIAVPTFIFFKGGKSVDRLDGANASDLTKKVRSLAAGTTVAPAPPPQKQDLNSRLKQLINQAPVMLFMKGDPQEPRCGFSRQITQILNDKNVSYSTFDILSDEEVRQGLKTFSNWPTFPQLYSNGELLGGLDIVKELVETGELESQLPTKVKIEDRSAHPLDSITQDKLPLCCGTVIGLDIKSQTENPNEINGSDTTRYTARDMLIRDRDLGSSAASNMSNHDTFSSNSEEDVNLACGNQNDHLPLWDDASHHTTTKDSVRGRELGSASRESRGDDHRREKQKLCQRERRDLIRSNPSLLAVQREKERLRMVMIRRRDSLIMSLPVDPHTPLVEANKMLVDQQRAAGVPEEDVTSLQIGRESFSTIGELKHRIEAKRALDRERTRMKRAQLDTGLKEDIKKACRERMREKRSRLRQFDPAAAAAHREREKIRKRIERRRNSLLLSLSQEGSDDSNGVSGLPLAPELSSALMMLRESLLRKRQEQKEKVRQKRADLRQNHPDMAAALREKERIRKKIERRRNSLLLNLSPDALLMVTQSMSGQDPSMEMLQALGNCKNSEDALMSDEDLESDDEMSPLLDSTLQTRTMNTDSVTLGSCDSESPSLKNSEWMSNIGKLKRSIDHKKEYNKERMRRNRARIKENPDKFEAMKERERVRKQVERFKKKTTGIVPDIVSPLMFTYDNVPASTVTSSQRQSEELEHSVKDSDIVKQEPLQLSGDSSGFSDTSDLSASTSSPRKPCLPPPSETCQMPGNDRILDPLTGGGQRSHSAMLDLRPPTVNRDMDGSSSTCSVSANAVNTCDENLADLRTNFNSENPSEHCSPVLGALGSMPSVYAWCKNDVSSVIEPPERNGGYFLGQRDAPSSDVCSFDGHSALAPVMQVSPVKQLNSLSRRAQFRKCSKPMKNDAEPFGDKYFPFSNNLGSIPNDCLKMEATDIMQIEDTRNDVRSDAAHIPSFTSVEEERDWFQTQLCRLQTRVADPHPQRTTLLKERLPSPGGHGGLFGTATIPANSPPNMSSFDFYNSTAGHPPTPYSSSPSVSVPSPARPPAADHLSGVAEMTLRSSLEQVSVLAGPGVVQERLQQMVESAKQAREKANEQARRRRERMRSDPALKQRYEVTKARDLERKRQMRAKEAQIRTVFPEYNEESRVKDRERKKMIRQMKCNNSEIGNEVSANNCTEENENLSKSHFLKIENMTNSRISAVRTTLNSAMPGAGELSMAGGTPPPPTFAGLGWGPSGTAHDYWTSVYAGYNKNANLSTMATAARAAQYLGAHSAEFVETNDIKPTMTPEQRG